jgi:zinc transporter ZupT
MYLLIVIGSLLLSVVAGGFFVTSLHRANKTQLIKILLAFSGGFLLSIAFNHFIPELYHEGKQGIGMYILLGFLIQLLLEFFSGGIEHGHVHVHKGQRMPWGLFLSLSVHSVLEGIPLGNEIAMSASAPGNTVPPDACFNCFNDAADSFKFKFKAILAHTSFVRHHDSAWSCIRVCLSSEQCPFESSNYSGNCGRDVSSHLHHNHF